MLQAIVIVVFLAAFFLLMKGLLYLIKHPDIDMTLEGKVMAHEPNIEKQAGLILTYLHEEEVATKDEIDVLLGSDNSSSLLLNYLDQIGEINMKTNKDGEVEIRLYDQIPK
jgi:hypothetical protein